jgi:integrase
MASIVRRIGKDGQVNYRVQVRRKGAPPLSATFTKLSDARKWAQMTEGAVLEGRHFTIAEAKRHTLADLIDRYRAHVLPQKAEETIYGQERELRWWKAQLGHYFLADVTPPLITACRDKLSLNHANATVNRYLASLSHAFTVAVREWQWCDDNPVRKVMKLREPRGRIRFLSAEERHRLLEECQASRNPHLYTVVILALATGARKGELISLRWSDIDLRRGLLTFHETKNGERRTVPLVGYALDVLTQHAKVRRLDTPLVFPNPTGGKFLRFREAFDNAVARACIPDFRFHDLRQSADSYLDMSGASLAEIAEVLGHKTLTMVKRYAHLSEAHTRDVVEHMNRAVFGDQ